MALFQWVTRLADDAPISDLAASVESLGLAVDPECSNHLQLYLRDSSGPARRIDSRVTVLVSLVDRRSHEVQMEVRSSEPMLTRGTRCEVVATAIKQLFPPLA